MPLKTECVRCGALNPTPLTCRECGTPLKSSRHDSFTTSRAFSGTNSLGNAPVQKHTHQLAAETGKKVVIALAGGGYGVIGQLNRTGGMSGTVLETWVLSHPDVFTEFNGGKPDQFASDEAARTLAMRCYKRCLKYTPEEDAIGIACSSSLRKAAWETERQGRKNHFHIAVQTSLRTSCYSVELNSKGLTGRVHQEYLLEYLLHQLFLNVIGLEPNRGLFENDPITPLEVVRKDTIVATKSMYDVVHGHVAHTAEAGPPVRALFSSSCNPLHDEHVRIINRTAQDLRCKVDVELCVVNADKPDLDYITLEQRISQTLSKLKDNENFGRLILSNVPLFFNKAKVYPGATFAIGGDTFARIISPIYYKGGKAGLIARLMNMKSAGTRFLVFPRGPMTFDSDCLSGVQGMYSLVNADYEYCEMSSTAIRMEKLR
jgi:hypothetical protein